MMNYDEVMKLALERGFYFPSCEIYADAQAGFWEYGPSGVGLKNKYLELWRRELVRRDNMLEIDGSQIMSQSVFEASGHLSSFADPIIQCKNCKPTSRCLYLKVKSHFCIERLFLFIQFPKSTP